MQPYINELKSFVLLQEFSQNRQTLVQYANDLILAHEEDRKAITAAFHHVYNELTHIPDSL